MISVLENLGTAFSEAQFEEYSVEQEQPLQQPQQLLQWHNMEWKLVQLDSKQEQDLKQLEILIIAFVQMILRSLDNNKWLLILIFYLFK